MDLWQIVLKVCKNSGMSSVKLTGCWISQGVFPVVSHHLTHTHTHTLSLSLSLTHSLTHCGSCISTHIQHNIYCATCSKSQWSDNNVQHSSITSVTPQPHTTSGSDFRQIWAMWQHSIVFTFVLPLHLHYCVFTYCLKHVDLQINCNKLAYAHWNFKSGPILYFWIMRYY
jgi:hypothetical protein